MSEPVYILKLGLENVRCFGEKAELDLSDGNGNWRQWTVIVGDNGLGKTTLLQVLAKLELGSIVYDENKRDVTYSLIQDAVLKPLLFSSKKSSNGFSIDFLLSVNNEQKEGFIKIKATDWKVKGVEFLGKYHELKVIGYGANRIISDTTLSDLRSENSTTLFYDDARLINAEEWLLNLDYLSSKESEIKNFAEGRRELVKETLKGLLLGIEDIQFTTPTKENLQSNVEFKTAFGWTKIQELSFGYKTMIAWVVDLAYRMFERYSDENNPLAQPAIVLVDEIDLHLHPKWQRKIFEYLSEKFPKTQFVVTAHSPLVVQSAPKDANIVVLRKEGDHVVIDNDVESVENWRLDQIMSALYGIESSRGPETEKWLEERKELLKRNNLTPEEEKRLDTLNEKADALPTADTLEDIEAMDFIRKAAHYLKNKVGVE